MNRICIAVPTFRRTEYLPALLEAIGQLAPPAGAYALHVLIVDNDTLPSAQSLVDSSRSTFPFPLRYEHLNQPGISGARNRILAYAKGEADLVAMLDDDELPETQWLAELVRVYEHTSAGAVVGPVLAILPSDAPQWVRTFRDREYPNFRDESIVTDGWTSNCLVNVARVADADLDFDRELTFSGGEDQLFFRRLVASGASIAYAANATVWEHLPAQRRSIAFILNRSFRRGNSLALCDRRLSRDARGPFIRAAKGVAIVVIGSLELIPMLLLRGITGGVLTVTEIARGVGMLAGLVGILAQPYRRGIEH